MPQETGAVARSTRIPNNLQRGLPLQDYQPPIVARHMGMIVQTDGPRVKGPVVGASGCALPPATGLDEEVGQGFFGEGALKRSEGGVRLVVERDQAADQDRIADLQEAKPA